MNGIYRAAAVAVLALTGCGGDDEPAERAQQPVAAAPVDTAPAPSGAYVYGDPNIRMTAEELERGRLDASWRQVVQFDSADLETPASREKWEEITQESVTRGAMQLPLGGDVAGPSVLRLQVLLDRALFSPGVIDGRWGKNTEKALYWFQKREGLRATGRLDEETFERLKSVGGSPSELAREHTLTADDVEGPFVTLPEDIYEKAKLDCMCYESLEEKLAEQYHTTPGLLKQLNDGVDLNTLRAGGRLHVPNVRGDDAGGGTPIARLVVSDAGHYLHAVDANGRIVYHFPTTLGSDYSPSPSGDFKVTGIAQDPDWHYQPELLTGVPDDEEDVIIPPGPNSAVGVTWMALSKPHYGIHGTSAPETIGYTTSSGCVRLTNWDARFLSRRIEKGIPVEFRDVDNRAPARST